MEPYLVVVIDTGYNQDKILRIPQIKHFGPRDRVRH